MDGFLALLHRYYDSLWDLLEEAGGDLTCVSGSGEATREHPVSIHGGETDTPYKTFLVVTCPLPPASFGERCHEVTLKDRGVEMGNISGCQTDSDTKPSQVDITKIRSSLSSNKFELAACVKPLYHV